MNNNLNSTIEDGKRVIRIEAEAVAALESRIDRNFADAVDILFNAKGRVVITGMGKSGIIARKIVATLNSTGTPSVFLHPSDAIHGDVGIVGADDVIMTISKSGDTDEILQLTPLFRRLGVKLIALVGNVQSEIARQSDIVLDIGVKEEACPHDLAPTSSTTATLALGDAIAIALLQRRNFTKEDFARFHPGGNLGKQLHLQVEAIMASGTSIPKVAISVPLSEAIMEITTKRLGATCVINGDGRLAGIITDGDLRRLLQRVTDISKLTAADAMTKNPKTIRAGLLAVVALEEMETYNITQLVVVDSADRPVGVVHLHDLVKAGLGSGDSQG